MGKLLVFHGEPQRCTGGIQCLPRVQGCREGSSALSGQQCMKVSDDYACTVAGGLGGALFCCWCLSHYAAGSPQQGFNCMYALARPSSVDFISSVCVCVCVVFWLSGLVGRQCPHTGHWLHFLPCA